MLKIPIHFSAADFSSLAESDAEIAGKGPAPNPPLLASPGEHGRDFYPLSSLTNKESPDPFWSINFVPRNGGQIQAEGINVHGDFPETLCQIRVEENSPLSADCPDLPDPLSSWDFIVDQMNRGSNSSLCNGVSKELGIEDPISANRQVGNLESSGLQKSKAVQDAFVLDLGRDEMVLLGRAVKPSQSLDS